ncbi:hypothetical protein T12_15815, partial [Trichinella patagoniensis]
MRNSHVIEREGSVRNAYISLTEKERQYTHKCHINIEITGTCIRQPFTISYMHKFICMLNAREGSVRNAYISLTEKERQY